MPVVHHEITPAMRVLQLATQSWMSAAVSAVATLGIADQLQSGARPVREMADDIEADAPTLYRLMRACTDIGLFDESEGQVFALTDVGAALCTDAPNSMRNFARWTGLPADRYTWSELTRTVRTGEPAFVGVHGQDVWDYMQDNPETAVVFDDAMTELSRQVIAPVVDTYDYRGFSRIVDVGGGHGALLAAILAAAPDAHGVLLDQPDVIAGAGKQFADAGVRDRCELVGGDFFHSVPALGDVYLLSNILHDWDDEPSLQILANCRDAMADHGRVLLIEAVLPEGPEPSLMVKLMDLDMLVLSGGRQRTGAEFDALLRQAGLTLSRIIPSGLCSIVEAGRA